MGSWAFLTTQRTPLGHTSWWVAVSPPTPAPPAFHRYASTLCPTLDSGALLETLLFMAARLSWRSQVGLARSMSDAAFVATVCDVAVSPAVQGRGIGKRLVRNLVADMRSLGPSSFAVSE
jgi:GNAT superfamily N-acetyltransferase